MELKVEVLEKVGCSKNLRAIIMTDGGVESDASNYSHPIIPTEGSKFLGNMKKITKIGKWKSPQI